MFYQADLFEQPQAFAESVDLPDLVERISRVSRRPRYAFMVLNLIAKEAGNNGSLGPYVCDKGGRVPVRDWLCQALAPLARRDCRRLAMVEAVRAELAMEGQSPEEDPSGVQRRMEEEIRSRILRSGRTNVSRAVSDLVRAGVLRRHYQGFRVDHPNRGAQREAVYTIMPEVKRALARV
ncbi:hypothetical protein [Sphingobium sp.]|uniref:hypothetical protein n=1 Tax=Sphingobium sp. TaxID=1912891 RepID=UPI0028BE7AC2|nr:hypothetical protein [Sphingobium sp.]